MICDRCGDDGTEWAMHTAADGNDVCAVCCDVCTDESEGQTMDEKPMSGTISATQHWWALDALTPAQEALMIPWAEQWIRWGLDTTPADHAVVEDGIRRCYQFAGLAEPKSIVWVRSPLTVAFAGPLAASTLSDSAVGSAVDSAVRSAVRSVSAVDSAASTLSDSAVCSAVYSAVSAVSAVGSAVDSAVDSAVRSAVSAVRSEWARYIGGQWWAGWLAWRLFFREIGLDLPGDLWDRADAYAAANQAGWWWPHDQFVVVAERPTALHMDPAGRLHHEAHPSIQWGDEWALWSWHGRTVPEWVITDPTPERIAAEANVEIRRCAIEHLGWDRWIAAAGLRPLSSCDDPGNPGHTLDLHALPDDPDTRVLLVTNGSVERDGTRRRYGLPVPATCRTPLDAAAWTYDVDPDTYAQIARRT